MESIPREEELPIALKLPPVTAPVDEDESADMPMEKECLRLGMARIRSRVDRFFQIVFWILFTLVLSVSMDVLLTSASASALDVPAEDVHVFMESMVESMTVRTDFESKVLASRFLTVSFPDTFVLALALALADTEADAEMETEVRL